MLHRHSRAAYFNGDLYGSLNSIHSNAALVYAKTNNSITTPGFVRKCYMVNVILQVNDGMHKQQLVYLVSINWLKEHEHKHWFGNPVEVWQRFTPPAGPDDFIPMTNLLCRCAHLTNAVKFNDIMEESVTIVVPLNHFAGLI